MSRSDRRERRALVALAIVVAGAVVASFFGFLEQAQRQTYQQPTQEHSNDVDDATYNGWRDTYAQWAMAFLAIGATGIGIWTIFLLQRTIIATRKGNKISRDIGEAQARAYVGYLTAGWEREVGSNVLVIAVTMKNYGQTPAHKVAAWCLAERAIDPTMGMDNAQDVIRNFTIPPTGEIHLSAVHGPAFVGGTLVTERNAIPSLIFYGQVTYEDAFKVPRFTNFRLRAIGAGFAPEPEGNDSN